MSEKNFASYGDMETLVTEIVDKCGPYTEISYEDWLQLTPYQQEHGRWDVTGVPGADGTISIDLMTKLWENPNPTQAFASQNISLSSSDYDMLLIVFAVSSNSTRKCSEITIKGFGATLSIAEYTSTSSSNRTRYISYTSDTVFNVSNGYINGTQNNSIIIPYQIYGIKLHHVVEIEAIAPNASTLAKKCVFDPTGTDLESTNAEDAIKELESNFQAGVDAVYNAVVAKGSTPASHSLSDIIAAIAAIPTGITPSGTYTYPSGSTGGTVDVTNYAKVNAANVYSKGKADGDVKHTVTVKNDGSRDTTITVSKDGKAISTAVYDPDYSRSFTI